MKLAHTSEEAGIRTPVTESDLTISAFLLVKLKFVDSKFENY
jgi:hypothetical protein